MIYACPECRNEIGKFATSCKCGWTGGWLGEEPQPPQTSFQLDWQRLYDKVCRGPVVDGKYLVLAVERLAEKDPNRRLQQSPESSYVRNPFYEIPLTTTLVVPTVLTSLILYLLRNARYLPVDLATMILEVVED